MTRTQKILLGLGISLVGILILGGIFRGMFFTFVDKTEYGYKFNAITGEMYELKYNDSTLKQGYIFKWPIIERVNTIDMKPIQVCINANSRVLNCKLVSFNPKGFKTLIEWHGRQDYNGLMFEQILMSYAYDADNKNYPFLNITKELASSTNNDKSSINNKETISE